MPIPDNVCWLHVSSQLGLTTPPGYFDNRASLTCSCINGRVYGSPVYQTNMTNVRTRSPMVYYRRTSPVPQFNPSMFNMPGADPGAMMDGQPSMPIFLGPSSAFAGGMPEPPFPSGMGGMGGQGGQYPGRGGGQPPQYPPPQYPPPQYPVMQAEGQTAPIARNPLYRADSPSYPNWPNYPRQVPGVPLGGPRTSGRGPSRDRLPVHAALRSSTSTRRPCPLQPLVRWTRLCSRRQCTKRAHTPNLKPPVQQLPIRASQTPPYAAHSCNSTSNH